VTKALRVSEGESLLVHAAAGGVGSLAAQIGVALGARVIGTASEPNHEYLRRIGVEPVSYGDGMVDSVASLVPDGVDAVFDAYGRNVLDTTSAIGKNSCRMCTIVGTYPQAISVGVRANASDLADLVDMVERRELSVRTAGSYPLKDAAEAMRASMSEHSPGKIAIRIG
jgi:NADPH:quinone reductase-like Zn-dependent oxidoreductase